MLLPIVALGKQIKPNVVPRKSCSGLKRKMIFMLELHSKDTYESSGQQKPCDVRNT